MIRVSLLHESKFLMFVAFNLSFNLNLNSLEEIWCIRIRQLTTFAFGGAKDSCMFSCRSPCACREISIPYQGVSKPK